MVTPSEYCHYMSSESSRRGLQHEKRSAPHRVRQITQNHCPDGLETQGQVSPSQALIGLSPIGR